MTTNRQDRPVFLLAGSGFVLRNLLFGTFADEVSRRHSLIVAVQNPQDERLQALVHGKDITLVPFLQAPAQPPGTRLEKLFSWQTYVYRFKSAAKGTVASQIQTRQYESSHSPAGWIAIKTLTHVGRVLKRVRRLETFERAYLRKVEDWPITARWRAVFEETRPSAVISTLLTLSTNRRHSEDLPAVVAAHQLGIPCGTLVQSWDNLSSKTSISPPWLNYYWTWSETMSRELLELNPNVDRAKVRVVGSPQFDFHRVPDLLEPREAYFERLGLDPKRPLVLIGTGTKRRLPYEVDTISELVHAFLTDLPACQVLIRLHPKDDRHRWEAVWDELESLGVVFQETAPALHMDAGGFVLPRDFYHEQINAISHSVVVINHSSTISVDAAILDRPVICIAYDSIADARFPEGRAWLYTQATHYQRLTKTGGITVVRSKQDCVDAVRAHIDDPGLCQAERREIVVRVAGAVDGRSGERLAGEVLKMVSVHSAFSMSLA